MDDQTMGMLLPVLLLVVPLVLAIVDFLAIGKATSPASRASTAGTERFG